MRAKYWIPMLMCLPSIAWGIYVLASWQSVGNALQRSNDAKNFRTDLGSNRGFAYWYQKGQIDSLFLNIPNVSIADSSHKPLNTATFHQYIAANQVYFSPLYFYNSGSFSTPIKVGNSDSLGHQGPPYYLNYNNLTNKPTIYSFTGNSSQYTTGAGLYVTFPTNISSFTNDAGYATVTQVKASLTTNLFGQTATIANVGTYANTGTDNTFTVSAWVNLLATSSDSLKVQVTWTDGHSVSHTKIFTGVGVSSTGNMGTVTDYALLTNCIRAENATNIVVSTTVTGAGSILYEIGCVIEKKVGNGGL